MSLERSLGPLTDPHSHEPREVTGAADPHSPVVLCPRSEGRSPAADSQRSDRTWCVPSTVWADNTIQYNTIQYNLILTWVDTWPHSFVRFVTFRSFVRFVTAMCYCRIFHAVFHRWLYSLWISVISDITFIFANCQCQPMYMAMGIFRGEVVRPTRFTFCRCDSHR